MGRIVAPLPNAKGVGGATGAGDANLAFVGVWISLPNCSVGCSAGVKNPEVCAGGVMNGAEGLPKDGGPPKGVGGWVNVWWNARCERFFRFGSTAKFSMLADKSGTEPLTDIPRREKSDFSLGVGERTVVVEDGVDAWRIRATWIGECIQRVDPGMHVQDGRKDWGDRRGER